MKRSYTINRQSYCLVIIVLATWLFPALSGSTAGKPCSPRDASYLIDKQAVQLIDGYAENEAAPGSAARVVTQVVNTPVFGDLDGDGQADAALFLSQAPGGSGTFTYVTAVMMKAGRCQGTNAVYIGDRVAPQEIRINDGVIIVRYLDRLPEESMAAVPSIEKTIEIELVGEHLEMLQP